ncbi:hypothetical protein ACH5RR_014928 [Cinchona calisaya]|uniref:Uncharacterized protein n=1 Tax=Cinchona calisaya TaxID=153742 RepID=A0ABD2ZSH8_9GENT
MFSDWDKVWPLNYNRKLSLAEVDEEKLNIVVLEDYKKQKWSEKKIVISLEFMRKYPYMRNTYHFQIDDNWLYILGHDRQHLLGYDITAEMLEIIHSVPSGKELSYVLYPSLVHLQGNEE